MKLLCQQLGIARGCVSRPEPNYKDRHVTTAVHL